MDSLLNISKTSLYALQNNLDVIANDLANANTDGYKAKDLSFRELLHNDLTRQDVLLGQNANQPSLPRGTRSYVESTNFTQGAVIDDGQPYHLAISGNGFFGVRTQGNELLLTRSGAFHLDANKNIVNDQGQFLEMNNTLPKEQWPVGPVAIDSQGNIFAGEEGNSRLVGRVPLYQLSNLENLNARGENQYEVLPGANLQSSLTNPENFGIIKQGALEASNVDMAKSFTEMIITQRAYSMNNRVLQATDEMMQKINEFKQ